ncbi:MAG: DUF5329 domain-containing protein [Colwellia sp.]|nr:DUF5329 domain-containing protein [Colwellia sp.]
MSFIKIIIISLLMLSFNSLAASQDEIDHLLNFVASTECLYERNGTMHSGDEAVGHIKKKYAYYHDDIRTAEEFISYSATKSKMSGKYYQIHCGSNPPIKSRDWLMAELKAYRLVLQ